MAVRNAILGLLAQQPRHGYEIHGAFQAIMGSGVWPLNPSQIYTTLNRLEEAGLIAQMAVRRAGGPDQRVFSLTDLGRAELDSWYAQGITSTHQRDEVYLKITIALGDESGDPEAIIREQRATFYRDLHELTARRNEVANTQGLAQALLLDKAIMHIEADLRWLEMAEARLHEMKQHALPELPPRRRGRPRSVPDSDQDRR